MSVELKTVCITLKISVKLLLFRPLFVFLEIEKKIFATAISEEKKAKTL